MKVVLVLNRSLPVGLLANAAAVLAFSVSGHIPGGVGQDLYDADGALHQGITRIPLPILAATQDELVSLRYRAGSLDGVGFVDFVDVAQRAKSYVEYEALLAATPFSEMHLLGLCIYGDPGGVRSISGNLPLLR